MPSKIGFDAGAALPCCFNEFTTWVPWSDRGALKEFRWHYQIATYPGVYLLGRFQRGAPKGPADYLAAGIVYVGEARNLGRRWSQFDDSAFKARPGHSGGWSYRAAYGDTPSRLYVAALPIWFGDDLHLSSEDWTQSYRLYVERRIVWEITVARKGSHGLLNRR